MKKKVHKTKGQFENPAIMGSRCRGCLHGGGGLQVVEVTRFGGPTRRMLPHLSEVPHLRVNRPLEIILVCRDSFVGGPTKEEVIH